MVSRGWPRAPTGYSHTISEAKCKAECYFYNGYETEQCSILQYCYNKRLQWSHLIRQAKKFLSIPATSTTSER